MPLWRKLAAEVFGTFWLVLGGCGAAVLAGHLIGAVGVSLAFGLTVVSMAYAVGHISGCHLNPAVTLGMVAARRFPVKHLLPYVAAQLVGAIAAAAVLYQIAKGQKSFNLAASGFACNGFAEHSPGHYEVMAVVLTEVVMTFMFMFTILGASERRAAPGFAALAVGLCLTLIHLISIPVDNTSVNPARSTGPALFLQGWALEQLPVFWFAPLIGAALAGLVYPLVSGSKD